MDAEGDMIRGEAVTKEYKTGEVLVRALRGVNFELRDGEFVVILGPSGSGKSTLLNLIGGLDTVTSGRLFWNNIELTKTGERALTRYRRQTVGFVFQFYNLVPNLTARENIRLAADIADKPFSVDQVMRDVDMADRASHFPSQLSGGQQQRVAIARAVVKNPEFLLCDEPTGALDVSTGIGVLKVLKRFNEEYKKTVCVITHNAAIAMMANRVLVMRDGQIVSQDENPFPVSPEEVQW